MRFITMYIYKSRGLIVQCTYKLVFYFFLQVSSMVFIAQFLVSAFMGAIIELVGSSAVIMVAAAILSLCGAVSASRVTYLGL